MKRIVTLLATAGALALMAPAASAQDWRDRDRDGGYEHADRYDHERYDRDDDRYDRGDHWRRGRDLGAQIDARQWEINNRINVGRRDGSLSRREGDALRYELYRIARLEDRYRHGGLSHREAADLHRRLDYLSRSVRAERNDDNNRLG